MIAHRRNQRARHLAYTGSEDMNGLLILDKPAGFTSHDVVARVRQICRERSVGHLGTLDPMATGVLPLALGNHTRLAQFYGESRKAYDGTIRFGFGTDTYDAEGERVEGSGDERLLEMLTLDEVRAAAATLTGHLSQMPPNFSAKKIGGVPAYKLARKKQEVELKPVDVEVTRFEVLELADGVAKIEVEVTSGTYIRSLAHELGVKVGIGAHLASLRRTKVGEFDIAEAVSFADLDARANGGDIESLLVHPRRVLSEWPAVTANEEQVAYIRNGRAVNLLELSTSEFVRVYANQTDLIAICRRIAGTLFHPKVVLAK
jgi:tRNA pseudouridine55 synthase